MKKEKKEVKKEEKADRVVLDVPIPQRALGIKLPSGNPVIVAVKTDPEKVPTYLRPVFDRVLKAGKDGIKIDALAPTDTGEGRVHRWHVRTLMNEKCGGFLKAIPDPTREKKPKVKELSIAKAAAKKAKKAAAAKKVASEEKATAKEAHKAHKKAA